MSFHWWMAILEAACASGRLVTAQKARHKLAILIDGQARPKAPISWLFSLRYAFR
jgi:hypothetical protein